MRPDALAYPPRGMSREIAARYVGVGVTKFDELVADGRMPKPKRIDGRRAWDRLRLDFAFEALPDIDGEVDGENEWDRAIAARVVERNPWDRARRSRHGGT